MTESSELISFRDSNGLKKCVREKNGPKHLLSLVFVIDRRDARSRFAFFPELSTTVVVLSRRRAIQAMKELMGSNKRDKKKGFYPLVPVYLERFSIILSCLLSPQFSRNSLVHGFVSSTVSRIRLKQDYIRFLDFVRFSSRVFLHSSPFLLNNSMLVPDVHARDASDIISSVIQYRPHSVIFSSELRIRHGINQDFN